MSKLLIVDDDADSVELLADYLASMGHEVRYVCAAEDAVQMGQVFCPDALIVDYMLGHLHGTDVIRALRRQGLLHMGVLMLTGLPKYELQDAITPDLGVVEIRLKPVGLDDISGWVAQLGNQGNATPAGFH